MNPLLILAPPIALLIVLVFVWIQYKSMKILSAGEKWPDAPGKGEAYGCGENVPDPHAQPDYSTFFPFAFFFTIMHVAALVVGTVPPGGHATTFAVLYLVSAVIGLFILFRR